MKKKEKIGKENIQNDEVPINPETKKSIARIVEKSQQNTKVRDIEEIQRQLIDEAKESEYLSAD